MPSTCCRMFPNSTHIEREQCITVPLRMCLSPFQNIMVAWIEMSLYFLYISNHRRHHHLFVNYILIIRLSHIHYGAWEFLFLPPIHRYTVAFIKNAHTQYGLVGFIWRDILQKNEIFFWKVKLILIMVKTYFY
jgi:hypothetical protein